MVALQSFNIGVLKPIITNLKESASDVKGTTRPITISDVIDYIRERYIKERLSK